MELYWILLTIVGVVGILVGSFLNVVIYRFETELKFWQGRSQCMSCRHVLEWFDLVPVFSFISIRGKCRYCRAPLSWQYPLIEMVTGLLAMSAWYSIFPNFTSLIQASLWEYISLSILWFALTQAVVIFVYDLKTMLIPDISLKLLQLSGLAWVIVKSLESGMIFSGLWTGITCGIGIFLLYVLTKKQGMGFGDVELILGLGLFFPFYIAFWFFFVSFLIGSLWGLIYVIWARSRTLRVRMPFGPSIILSWLLIWALSPYWTFLQNYWAVLQ